MIERKEILPPFRLRGTIIDIETTGDFNFEYPSTDSRYYENLSPTIFGYARPFIHSLRSFFVLKGRGGWLKATPSAQLG